MEKAIESIANETPYIDIKPYSHNIISLQLSIIENEGGLEKVKECIKKFKLDKKGWGWILETS